MWLKNIFYSLTFLLPATAIGSLWPSLLRCNDLYFDADTAEIPQQIGTVFLSHDLVKHPLFYFLSTPIYSIFRLFHLSPGLSTLIVFVIYITLLVYSFISVLSKLKMGSSILEFCCLLTFVASPACAIIFMPETYALSSAISLLALHFLSSNISSEGLKKLSLNSIYTLAVAALCGANLFLLIIPYAFFSCVLRTNFYNFSMQKNIRILSLESIPSLTVFSIPYFASYIFGLNDYVISYIDHWTDPARIISPVAYLQSFVSVFIFSIVNPTPVLQRFYSYTTNHQYGLALIIIYITFFLSCAAVFIRFYLKSSYSVNTILTSHSYRHTFVSLGIPFIFLQFIMFNYLAPDYSILYSPNVIVILLPILFLGLDVLLSSSSTNHYVKKLVIFITLALASYLLVVNITSYYNTFRQPVLKCRDWGVKNVVVDKL